MRKRKKKVYFNIFFNIIAYISIAITLIFCVQIIKLGMLPIKYLSIVLGIIIFIYLILILLTFPRKIKKKIKSIACIFFVIFGLIFGFGIRYIDKTIDFFNSFTSNYNYETKNYLVVVLKNSGYDDIKSLKNKKIGYVDSLKDMKKATDKLDEVINLEYVIVNNYDDLYKDLLNKKIDAILINDSYFGILKENHEDLEEKTETIYQFDITEKSNEIKKEANITKETFNIYLSGIDTYGAISSSTRSDVNIVVSINPKTHQILMINIPRDYYVELSGYNAKDKLTHAGMYGTETSVTTIENLLGIDINYYVKVNYYALIKLVDALDGVDVYSKYNFTSAGKGYYFKKGYNHVTGAQALDFVRTRKAFSGGDRVRGENQQAMIQAIIKKALSPTIIKKYTTILESLEGSFITNMPYENISALVSMQLDEMPSWNITSLSLDGSDSSAYTYTFPHQKLYVMSPNLETLDNVKKSLELVKSGEILDSSYQENEGKVNVPVKSPAKKEPVKKEEPKKDTTETNNSSENNKQDSNQNSNVNIESSSNQGTSNSNDSNSQENNGSQDSVND